MEESMRRLNINSISAFHEYGQKVHKSPTLKVVGQEGPPHQPIFTVIALLGNDEVGRAQGCNKKDAKEAAAENALKMLAQRRMEDSTYTCTVLYERSGQRPNNSQPSLDTSYYNGDKNPVSVLFEYSQAIGKDVKFESHDRTGPQNCPTFKMSAALGARKFPCVEAGNKKECKKLAAIEALRILKKEGKQLPNVSFSRIPLQRIHNETAKTLCPDGKNPVQIIYEYAQSRGHDVELIADAVGTKNSPRFSCHVRLDSMEFTSAIASNKQEAKFNASLNALQALLKEGTYKPYQANINSSLDSVATFTTFQDRVAKCSHEEFEKEIVKIQENISGRKVIAAILLYNDNDDSLRVIALGSGNRCINGNSLSETGLTLNDSHAEVIARRGFKRYISQMLINGDWGNIFEFHDSTGLYRLLPNLSFHLYISTAPCGDGAVFSHNDCSDTKHCIGHQPTFDNEKQGQLRMKMENGEGTIPVAEDQYIQTLDGIKRGERLRTMSCSDKICRWNVLGLQGALLSQYVQTLYIKTMTIGQLYNHGHLSRAVCCRVEAQRRLQLPDRYKVTHPELGTVSQPPSQRSTDRTRAISINWNAGDGTTEITDGTTGLVLTSERSQINKSQSSRLAKKQQFEDFKKLHKSFQSHYLQNIIHKTYLDVKLASTAYQAAKKELYDSFERQGYGQWISKPVELQQFR